MYSLLLEISHMLKTITQDLALVYSKIISSSGFHAGSTMHKNRRFAELCVLEKTSQSFLHHSCLEFLHGDFLELLEYGL